MKNLILLIGLVMGLTIACATQHASNGQSLEDWSHVQIEAGR